VTLLNNGGDAPTVSSNGGFAFSTRQKVGEAYAGSRIPVLAVTDAMFPLE